MWFQVAVQSSFQLIVQLGLLSFGYRIFPTSQPTTDKNAPSGVVYFSEEHICIVFNVFVWLQVFNFLNARLLNENEHFFDNWRDSKVLCVIVTGIAVLQVFIVQCGGKFMSTVPLSFSQWVLCILIGSLSLAVGAGSRWYYWGKGRGGNRLGCFTPVFHLVARLLPKVKH
ncbi:Cation transporting ATPase, C-terminus, putative [Angomonas deanei]|uniref:Cation transporting ATPase, C-terminus, putative n=1 Tax=Angomonas deanei TaxID=59799 RepID=A0A7G2CFL1_9TRYP|nr:Cation transporting ATPase, C-terminus, putative [Angomonas deanei]